MFGVLGLDSLLAGTYLFGGAQECGKHESKLTPSVKWEMIKGTFSDAGGAACTGDTIVSGVAVRGSFARLRCRCGCLALFVCLLVGFLFVWGDIFMAFLFRACVSENEKNLEKKKGKDETGKGTAVG